MRKRKISHKKRVEDVLNEMQGFITRMNDVPTLYGKEGVSSRRDTLHDRLSKVAQELDHRQKHFRDDRFLNDVTIQKRATILDTDECDADPMCCCAAGEELNKNLKDSEDKINSGIMLKDNSDDPIYMRMHNEQQFLQRDLDGSAVSNSMINNAIASAVIKSIFS